jgi:uncharacterized RDD family membrane protein YckC
MYPQQVSLRRRAAAFLLDCVFFYFLVFTPMFTVLFMSMGVQEPTMAIFDNRTTLMGINAGMGILFLFFLFYKSSFEYAFSQTPGKRALGLRVGGVSSFGKAIGRNISFFIPILLIFDFFPMIFSDRRLMEKLTNTQVLNAAGEMDNQ